MIKKFRVNGHAILKQTTNYDESDFQSKLHMDRLSNLVGLSTKIDVQKLRNKSPLIVLTDWRPQNLLGRNLFKNTIEWVTTIQRRSNEDPKTIQRRSKDEKTKRRKERTRFSRGFGGLTEISQVWPGFRSGFAEVSQRFRGGFAEVSEETKVSPAKSWQRFRRGFSEVLPRFCRGFAEVSPRFCRGFAEVSPRFSKRPRFRLSRSWQSFRLSRPWQRFRRGFHRSDRGPPRFRRGLALGLDEVFKVLPRFSEVFYFQKFERFFISNDLSLRRLNEVWSRCLRGSTLIVKYTARDLVPGDAKVRRMVKLLLKSAKFGLNLSLT